MEADLRTALLAATSLTDLAKRRIDWNARPQGTGLPAITLHRITSGRTYTQAGRVGLETPTVQMDCWAANIVGALALRDALIAVLDTLTTAPFEGAFIVAERHDFTPEAGGAAAEFNLVSLDVQICWQGP